MENIHVLPKQELDCPYSFTSRCTMGRCNCKQKEKTTFSSVIGKETLEEVAERKYGTDMDSVRGSKVYDLNADIKKGFVEGAKWLQKEIGLMEIELNHTKRLLLSCEKALEERDRKQEIMYSEEYMLEFANWCRIQDNKKPNRVITTQQLFEQFKKK